MRNLIFHSSLYLTLLLVYRSFLMSKNVLSQTGRFITLFSSANTDIQVCKFRRILFYFANAMQKSTVTYL